MEPLYLFDSNTAGKWLCTQNESDLQTKITPNGLGVYGSNHPKHMADVIQFTYMDLDNIIELEPGYTKLYTEISAAYVVDRHNESFDRFRLCPAHLNSQLSGSYSPDNHCIIPFVKRNGLTSDIYDYELNFEMTEVLYQEYKDLKGKVFPAVTVQLGTTHLSSLVYLISKIWLE